MTIRRWMRARPRRILAGVLLGFSLSLLWGCLGMGRPSVTSYESAASALNDYYLPNISVETALVADEAAARYAVDQIAEPLPAVADYPLYGAQPTTDPNQVYIEIFSSSEKANVNRQNERWLVEVADAFNARQEQLPGGQVIQVGVRQVPSGTAARLLAAGSAQPAGYSPSHDLWVEMIKSQGVEVTPVAQRLVPNTAGWVLPADVYQQLSDQGPVTFERLLDGIASGQVTVAYPNPYTSSTALNLLYTLFWYAAGHSADGGALTPAEIASAQVSSVFDQFQSQVLITTPTTLDLQELFLRDQSRLQAFPLEYQNYVALKQVPGFESTEFVPFGIPHNNPLVGFSWNAADQAAALQRFSQFALSPDMQALAEQQGFVVTDYLTQGKTPPIPSGETLLAVQSNWKSRKDSGRTVYMMLVIDTSGSMEGPPLQAVQDGLRIATQQINAGNYVGMVTFGDRPVRRVPLAPFDTLQQQRLLAAIDQLQADGNTAMYDGMLVGLGDLLEKRATDPNGRFFLLLLSDGVVNRGYQLAEVEDVLAYSDVRFYPIAYGEVDQEELTAIASLRESTVQQGSPANVQSLFKDLFQINL